MSLRWRIAALTTILLVLFAVVLGVVVSWVVLSTLERVQQDSLVSYSADLQQLYASDAPGAARPRILGGVEVALFNSSGTTFVNSSELPVDSNEAKAGFAGRRFLRTGGLMIMLEPVTLGKAAKPNKVLAVAADAGYIDDLRYAVRNATVLATAGLMLLALAGGYVSALFGLRPLIGVARQTRGLNETNLEPIAYSGARDELGVLVETLNRMVQRLKMAFAAQQTFLAEAAHELRTPLTAIEGYIRRAAKGDDAEHALQDAARVAQNMTRLVSDLLQLSRGEVVKELIPHLVDLNDIVRQIASECTIERVVLPKEPLELVGDPDRLAQLLRNLTANAVRAAGAGNVQLEARRAGKDLELIVQDFGSGIPPELLPHIFEKFVKGNGGGSGLGLAIVAQIARAHGGKVNVTSNPGQGTRFVVTLPALEDEQS
jgi:two-component system, OmpR family, sensor kinase